MKKWNFACPDWEDRIRARESLLPDLPLYDEQVRKALIVFGKLHIPDVVGTPSFADVGKDWIYDPVRALFGSLDPDTMIRHVREIFQLVPKKNAKTTNGAAIMVTALALNIRPRAEFLLIGPTQTVSDRAFEQAVGMIQNDPEGYLQKRMHIQDHRKRIIDRMNGAMLSVKTFDTKIVTGAKPAGVLIDELHEISSMADADRVIGQLRGGIISQSEGFLIFITTQSERPPAGVFRIELSKARAIRDGRIEGAMLPLLYEFPADMIKSGEWENPKNWPMVTPNLGCGLTIERLVEDARDAKFAGEQEYRRWASQHLNIEIGLALADDRWPGADFWEAMGDTKLTLEQIISRSDVGVFGIDGGGLDDLLGLAFIGRDRETREWLHWSHTWAHQSVFERRKEIAARLLDFQQDGELTVVKELGSDVRQIAEIVAWIDSLGILPEKNAIGVDPVGIGQIVDEIAAMGLDTTRIVGVPQGWKLNGAIKALERKLAERTFTHAGQALMAWCVGNAKAEPRGNAISITKQAAGKAKIDTLMATFNAASLMSLNPEAMGALKSPYENEGFSIKK
ncbi:MAG TPA: terminase TerL endonuclease subunit [Xanthobacteraceae bacterium]|nr:terminase TerL endonuclease subunit [Xanthobacteraceae bacterium]